MGCSMNEIDFCEGLKEFVTLKCDMDEYVKLCNQ